ncbi:hypothetical protein ACF8FB_01390 [Pseudomonas sp. yb_2]|uniref:hypothetical protein n=1 Tax=Pseudomonas sp. yb_2 TaxID=3367218 RepID=UPI00370CED01
MNPDNYYFVVEGCGLVDGRFGPWVRIVSNVEEVDSLCKGGTAETLSVNKIQLIAPPSMTRRSELSMQLLSEIRIKPGSQTRPVYEFVTHDGQVYSNQR